MENVISTLLLIIIVVSIASGVFLFLRSSVQQTAEKAEVSVEKTIQVVQENIKFVGFFWNNISLIPTTNMTIEKIFLDTYNLNFNPKELVGGKINQIQTNMFIFCPYSKIRLGDKIIIISSLGNRWDFDIEGEKVDKVFYKPEDFDILSGNWSFGEGIRGWI